MSYLGDLSELFTLMGEVLEAKGGSTSPGWQTVREHCGRIFADEEIKGGLAKDYAKHVYKKYLKLAKKEALALGFSDKAEEIDRELRAAGSGIFALVKIAVVAALVVMIVSACIDYFSVKH